MSTESTKRYLWLVAPFPDHEWGSDLRSTARLFETEVAARVVLDNCPPEFHLWRVQETITVAQAMSDYELVE